MISDADFDFKCVIGAYIYTYICILYVHIYICIKVQPKIILGLWFIIHHSLFSCSIELKKKNFSDDGLVPQTSLLPSIY